MARRHRAIENYRLLPRGVQLVIVVALSIIVAVPLLYVGLASLNSDLGVARGEFWPSSFSLGNYARIWSTVGLGRAIANSVLVCAATAVASSVIATLTAYVIVRFEFAGRLALMRAMLGLQSIPGTFMLLPTFVLFASIGSALGVQIVGSLWGLFIAYLTFALPFSTWVMITYLRGLPRELEEAALIDGATHLGVLFRVIVPLAWPGIIVSGIFAFLLGWNDVLFASVMTRPDTETAAVSLQQFVATQEGGQLPLYGQMMAASLVCAVPVVVLYLAFQRYLVGGLTAGGVK